MLRASDQTDRRVYLGTVLLRIVPVDLRVCAGVVREVLDRFGGDPEFLFDEHQMSRHGFIAFPSHTDDGFNRGQ